MEEAATWISLHEIWQQQKKAAPLLTLAILLQSVAGEARVRDPRLEKGWISSKICHAYFRRGGNAKMDWRGLKAYSHIFH